MFSRWLRGCYKEDCHFLEILEQPSTFNNIFAPWELLLRDFRTGKASGAYTAIAQHLQKQCCSVRPPKTEVVVGTEQAVL